MGATSTLQRTATGVTDPVEEPGSPEHDAGGDGGQPEVTSPHRMAQTAAATITMRTAAAEATAGGGGEPGATKQVRWLVRRSKSGAAYPRCYCCYVEEPHPQRANHGCTGGRWHANGCRRRRGKQWQRWRAWHGTGALPGLLAYICWNTPGVVVAMGPHSAHPLLCRRHSHGAGCGSRSWRMTKATPRRRLMLLHASLPRLRQRQRSSARRWALSWASAYGNRLSSLQTTCSMMRAMRQPRLQKAGELIGLGRAVQRQWDEGARAHGNVLLPHGARRGAGSTKPCPLQPQLAWTCPRSACPAPLRCPWVCPASLVEFGVRLPVTHLDQMAVGSVLRGGVEASIRSHLLFTPLRLLCKLAPAHF